MNGFLRQSTASQVRTIGPFIDSTDFITPLNALSIANTDILIKKNGAASGAKNSGGATADGSDGLYHLTWDATDTGTVGELSYAVFESGALIVFGTYVVLEEAVYDQLFAASATGAVPIASGGIASTAFAAGAITAAGIATGAIDADALATDAVNEIADGVWDEALSGHVTAGSAGAALTAAGGAGDPWATALPGAYAAGEAGQILGDLPADVLVILANLVTILSATNQMAFTGGNVDANLVAIEGSTDSAARFTRSVQCMAMVTIGVGSTLTNIITSAIDLNIAVANQMVGGVLYFPGTTTTGAMRYARATITAVTAGGVITVAPALPGAPQNGDIAVVL